MRLANFLVEAGTKVRFKPERYSRIFFLIGPLVVLSACSSPSPVGEGRKNLVDDQYSLRADRTAFDDLRKNIPAEVRRENDEKAFMDEMMSDLSRPPSEVRSRFSSILNKKRDLFNKEMNRAREAFNQQQQKERDAFSLEQADLRKSYSGRKVSASARKDFFDDLELKRRNFYTSQKEKRDEFEANSKDKRRDFDDYVRAKSDEFNQLHRDYSKRFEEARKAKADLKKQAEGQRRQQEKHLDEQYEPIRKVPPTVLQSGSGE